MSATNFKATILHAEMEHSDSNVPMSEPAKNVKTMLFTLKLFIAVKMTYSCCFRLGGNLDFLQKVL